MDAQAPERASAVSSGDMKAWRVRAGPEGETVVHNLSHNIAAIGWHEFDVPDRDCFPDRASYGNYIEESFPNSDEAWRRSARDQIWRFYYEIGVGDLVAVPLKNHGSDDDWIAIGRVLGEARRDDSQPVFATHRRSVEWLSEAVSKSGVDDDLRKSIDGPGTVRPIKSEQAFRRLLHLAEHGSDPGVRVPDALSGDEAGVVGPGGKILEGASKWVRVLTYEKDPEARKRCLAEHGTSCKVCDIDFGQIYGDFANGYIHVHHKTPVHQAAQQGEYELDPENDLVPVCPNCHAMLHHHPDKPCGVDELRRLMNAAAARGV